MIDTLKIEVLIKKALESLDLLGKNGKNNITNDELCERLLAENPDLLKKIKSLIINVSEKDLANIKNDLVYSMVQIVMEKCDITAIMDFDDKDLDILDEYEEDELSDDFDSKGDYYTNNAIKIDSFRQFMNDISGYPVLTVQQEVEYFTKLDEINASISMIKAGAVLSDDNSDEKLAELEAEKKRIMDLIILSNQRLVVSVCKRYVDDKYDILSACQDGNLGLIKAVERFDITKGYKFSTYATWWIRQSVSREKIDKNDSIRIPVHMYEKLRKYKRLLDTYECSYKEKPSDDYIMSELEMSKEQLRTIRSIPCDPVSLNSFVNPDGDEETELGDFVTYENQTSIEEAAMNEMLREDVQTLFNNSLSPKERLILSLRNGIAIEKVCSPSELSSYIYVPTSAISKEEAIKNCITTPADRIAYVHMKAVKKMEEFDALIADVVNQLKMKRIDNEEIKRFINFKREQCASACLTPTEYIIYCLCEGIRIEKICTLDIVGKYIGVTRERVRQIEAKAYRKLRHPSRSRYLEAYLPDSTGRHL